MEKYLLTEEKQQWISAREARGDEGTLLRQDSSWSPNEAGNEDFNYKACPVGWKQGKTEIKLGGLNDK